MPRAKEFVPINDLKNKVTYKKHNVQKFKMEGRKEKETLQKNIML